MVTEAVIQKPQFRTQAILDGANPKPAEVLFTEAMQGNEVLPTPILPVPQKDEEIRVGANDLSRRAIF